MRKHNKKPGRGGARPGAGRPTLPYATKKHLISLKLPGWLLQWMETQDKSRAELIEDALREVHGIGPPPEE